MGDSAFQIMGLLINYLDKRSQYKYCSLMLGKLAVGYEKFLCVVRAGDLVGAHSLLLTLLSHHLLLLAVFPHICDGNAVGGLVTGSKAFLVR